MIALLYDASALDGDEAGRDVFDQLDAIEPVLAEEHATQRVGVTLNLAALRETLLALRPAVVFNLVESVAGSDRLQTLVPLLLEELGIPFTGCGAAAMLLSNDKPPAKRLLAAHGLPVAAAFPGAPGGRADWIVKAAAAHASLHLGDASILRDATREEVAEKIRIEQATHGIPFFAEEFIDGREFNISLLSSPDGSATVLPPAEIDFSALPPGRENIVGYAAKWTEASAEYAGTVRTFSFPERDAPLLAELAALSEQAWRALGLSGYARVDFRVDANNRPRILEVNANPCLTPGAGFSAAAERAGLSYAALIRRIADAGAIGCGAATAYELPNTAY